MLHMTDPTARRAIPAQRTTTDTGRRPLTVACPIDRLDLNARALNQLQRDGILTVGQLVALTERDVLDIREIGAGTLDVIVAALAEFGLVLAGGAR